MFLQLGKCWHGYLSGMVAGYKSCWEQIAVTNLQMLRRVSYISVGILMLYLTLSIVTARPMNVIGAYALGLLVQIGFAAFIHASGERLRWRTRVIQALCLFFVLSLLAVVVYIGAIGMRDEPGIYFSPMTIVLSMLFILPFWYNVTFVTATTAAFVVLSSLHKAAAEFQLDVSMAILTWVLCITSNFVALDLRVRDMRLRSELMRRSCTDSLTGLMNKSTAEAAARAYLSGMGAKSRSALFVIDLDQFKQINDQMGHQAGDAALEVFGDSLMKLFRANDIVGRVGGDEFVALMKNTCDRRLVARRAALICETVRRTHFRDTGISLTCSIGIAICPDGNCSYDNLFRSADEQLYHVKRSGKNGFHIA